MLFLYICHRTLLFCYHPWQTIQTRFSSIELKANNADGAVAVAVVVVLLLSRVNVHCDQTPTVFVRSVSGQTLTERLFSSLSGGELFERITAEGYTMSEAEVINYMRQICEGVKHMHERNIIHLGKIIIRYKHYNVSHFYQLNFSSCSTCKISQVCSI